MPLLLCAAGQLAGCSRGQGTGSVTGVVEDPVCGLAAASYDMGPTFFAADSAGDVVTIEVQRGSFLTFFSDGISIQVNDASTVKATMLGMPLPFEPTMPNVVPSTPVSMTLYLNDTCYANYDRQPTLLEAVSGTITFDALWVPNTDGSREITGTFTAVHLIDPSNPTTRYADLDGDFSFLYTRGAPAQVFP